MPSVKQQGDFLQADFFQNFEGLNNTDSPFQVKSSNAVSGRNYDYNTPGSISKRFGHTRLNSSANAITNTTGMGLFNTTAGVKTVLRATDSKLQSVNTSTGATTTLTDDTVSASSTYYTSTAPVTFSQFNTPSSNTIWTAGGGLAAGQVLGYNGTSLTTNGSITPSAGSLSLAAAGADGSLPAGSYYYAIAFKKASTGAISNAALDAIISVGATNHVTVTFSGVTNPDSTKYTQVVIYRSAYSGVSGFTTGDVVATVNWSAGFYTDLGAIQTAASNIPRAGNLLLDNSTLSTSLSYTTVATFKRHLATASGSTVYFSDLNKPESWPSLNYISIPSGGNITGLAVINFNTPTTSSPNELLAVFKEDEVWIIDGSTPTIGQSDSDWLLQFVDFCGTPAQPLVVTAQGYLFWMNYRGAFMWDGSGKPIYLSRPIELDFRQYGNVLTTSLSTGVAAYFKKSQQIMWFISGAVEGTQCLVLKLDLRLTMPSVQTFLNGSRLINGVFSYDSLTYPIYACASLYPSASEVFYAGDRTGKLWTLYDNINADDAAAIPFTYRTKPDDLGIIGTSKKFYKVIVWCRESSTNKLTLNYWVNYRTTAANKASNAAKIADIVSIGLWDQGYWDVALWDQFPTTYTPVVFNLGNGTIGAEGDALTLEFQQSDVNSPVEIAGWSVLYSVGSIRK